MNTPDPLREREAFESWAEHERFDIFRDECAWNAWCARAALAASLPSPPSDSVDLDVTLRQVEKADAERYRWLRANLFGVDFAYGEPEDSVSVVTFLWPPSASIGADLDASIDAAVSAVRSNSLLPAASETDNKTQTGAR